MGYEKKQYMLGRELEIINLFSYPPPKKKPHELHKLQNQILALYVYVYSYGLGIILIHKLGT